MRVGLKPHTPPKPKPLPYPKNYVTFTLLMVFLPVSCVIRV